MCIRDRSIYGPSILHLWSIYGLSMVNIGLSMVHLWSIYGPSMVYLWSIYGIYRSIYGLCRSICGLSMVYILSIFRLYFVYLCSIYCPFMVYILLKYIHCLCINYCLSFCLLSMKPNL